MSIFNRNKRIAKAAKPKVLYGLEVGLMAIAVAIALNYFDER
jgi:hypothetical protein